MFQDSIRQDWVVKWKPFVEWWNSPNMIPTRGEFADEHGIVDWNRQHPQSGNVYHMPEGLYKSMLFSFKFLSKKFASDMEFLGSDMEWKPTNHLLVNKDDYQTEILDTHYRKILKYVRKFAETNPPPVYVPGLD